MATKRRPACFLLILASISLSTCTSPTQPASPSQARNVHAPQCVVEGCCEGHGKVAFVQMDKAIMCTDGTASEICDCH